MRINLGGRMRVSDQQYAEASRQDERPALHITFKHTLRFALERADDSRRAFPA